MRIVAKYSLVKKDERLKGKGERGKEGVVSEMSLKTRKGRNKM